MKKNENNNVSGLPRVVREINLQVVVREMRRNKTFSKIDLARNCGISTTTMTKLFAHLETDHLIEQSPEIDTSFGRPKTFYQLSPALQIAGIVIDIKQTTICLSNLQADCPPPYYVTIATGKNKGDLFTRIAKAFSKLQAQHKTSCRLIGVCIPGLIAAESGQSALNPNIRWLEGCAPAQEISKRLNILSFIMHEEMALSRAQLLAADDAANYITIDFSAGVGMNVVANGNHLSGTSGFAGEIGHTILDPNGKLCGCGNHGCLETIASDQVFLTELGLPKEQALEQLAQGKTKAVKAADQVIHAQATGIAMAINIFNPERIFVYSRLSEAYPQYIEILRKHTQKQAIALSFNQCTIEITREGKLKGTILLTIDRLIKEATG